MDITYILSQIFVIIQYIFIITTYQVKTKKQIIIFNTLGALSAIISFLCLKAYSGCMMSLVSIFRNILFFRIKEKDKSKLVIVLILLFILTIFTYNGILSLMPSIGTLLYTLSVWQNDTKIYKKYGVLIEMSWFLYFIYIKSLFGIVLEGISLISIMIGLKREKNKYNARTY